VFNDIISIRVRLLGTRKAAAEAQGLSTSIGETAAATEAANAKTSASAKRAAAAQAASTRRQISAMRSVGRGLTTYVTAPLALTGIAAGAFAIDFDRAMRNVNSIAQLPEPQLRALEHQVLGLAGPTAQAPKVLAEGLYDLVSSGFNAHEAMVVLRSSALAASAGLTTSEVSTKAVAAVINAYGLEARSAGHISDQLFETVNRGVLTFEELSSTIGDVLPFAAQLGVGLDQVGAAVSTMTKAGLSAPETMTRIKNVLVTLLKPGEDLDGVLKNMNTTGEDLVREKGLQGALSAIIAETDGTKSAVAELFPNIRAMGGVLALTGLNAGRAAEDLGAFNDTSNATARALAQQEQSVSFEAQRAWAELQAVLIELGQTILPMVVPPFMAVVGVAVDAVHAFADLPEPIRDTGLALIALLGLAGPSLMFAASIARSVQTLRDLRRVPTTPTPGTGWTSPTLNTTGPGVKGGFSYGRAFAGAAAGAIAAYGLVSVVETSMEGDWEKAGIQAGYAVAGGILGSIAGPEGALAGAGLGSMLGGAVADALFPEGEWEHRLRTTASQAKKFAAQMAVAGGALAGSETRVSRARKRSEHAAKALAAANRRVTNATREYGPGSRAAVAAEYRLLDVRNKNRAAIRRLKNAEREHGQALEYFKQIARTTVLEQRHEVNQLRDRAAILRRNWQAAQNNSASQETLNTIAEKGSRVNANLEKANKRLNETYLEASQKAGPKYARFLQRANQETLRAGDYFKALNERVTSLSSNLKRLAEIEVAPTLRNPTPHGGRGRPVPEGADGFRDFPGGLALVGERGPELAVFPRGTDLYPSGATRRLLGAGAGNPRQSTYLRHMGRRRGGLVAELKAPIHIGRREVAEAVFEVRQDDEARE
jgi:TP901 family phage tail tape measure protein